MATIKELIAQYRDKLAESKIDVSEVDPKVRTGVEGNVRNAIRDLPAVARLYKDEVMKHVVILGVSGSGAQEFANIVKYKHKLVTVDYYHILNVMAASLKKRGVKQDYYGNQDFWLTLDEFNKLRLDYDILHLVPPRINHLTDQVYGQPLEKALKNLIEANYNNQLYSTVARREIGAAALAEEFTGKAMPVILYNYPGNLDETLLPRPLITIEAGEKVDEAFVAKALADLRAKLNPKSTKKSTETAPETQGEQS
jgi:hypothetical protein